MLQRVRSLTARVGRCNSSYCCCFVDRHGPARRAIERAPDRFRSHFPAAARPWPRQGCLVLQRRRRQRRWRAPVGQQQHGARAAIEAARGGRQARQQQQQQQQPGQGGAGVGLGGGPPRRARQQQQQQRRRPRPRPAGGPSSAAVGPAPGTAAGCSAGPRQPASLLGRPCQQQSLQARPPAIPAPHQPPPAPGAGLGTAPAGS
jgi:hypothetical protein